MCRGVILVSKAEVVHSEQKHLVCRVTKRSVGRENDGTKMFRELERLGVSNTILESLRKAQERQTT